VTKNSTEEVVWSSEHQINSPEERRASIDRRQFGRSITVPDMRAGSERRSGSDRRSKVRLTITSRAMDV